MVLTDFLRNIQNNPGLLGEIAGQGTGIRSIAGTSRGVETGESTLKIQAALRQNQLNIAESNAALQQRLRAQQEQFNRITSDNLVMLGESSVDASQAIQSLSEGTFGAISEINERTSRQLIELGDAVGGLALQQSNAVANQSNPGLTLGAVGADIQEALTGDRNFLGSPLGLGVSAGTLAIGAVLLGIILLK